ncbi:hypothetical protein AALT_g1857 [Alternaria alternata]|nr:hypothetical protein AALT_g1857 [Alternaria alternata]
MKTQEQIELINTVLPNVCANDKPVYENMLLELYQRLSDEQRQSEADAEAPAKRVRQAGCPKPKRRKTIKIFEDEKEDDDDYKTSGVVSAAPPGHQRILLSTLSFARGQNVDELVKNTIHRIQGRN